MHSTGNTPFSPRGDYSNPSKSLDDDTQTTSKETTETGKVPADANADRENPDITEVKELPDLTFVGEELRLQSDTPPQEEPVQKSDKKEIKGTETDQTKSTEGNPLHALVDPPIDLDGVLTDSDGNFTPNPDSSSTTEVPGAQHAATVEALAEAAKTISEIFSEKPQ